MKSAFLFLIACGLCLLVGLCASHPVRAQEICDSISADELRDHVGDGLLADFNKSQTQAILRATEAPSDFRADEIMAIAAPQASVILLFFRDGCEIHAARVSVGDFEDIRKVGEGQPA